jgi:hypothetical protein
MSEMGHSRRFDPLPITSGPPRSTDIVRPVTLVRFVPTCDIEGVRVDRSRVPVFRHDKPLSAG